MNNILTTIESLFDQYGNDFYGEHVTQLSHALQAATLAENAGEDSQMITAALLHDIGHFLINNNTAFPEKNDDHDILAGKWLKDYFPENIFIPIALHAQAKRYLCATDSRYLSTLSDASLHSLKLQGGIMNSLEVKAFEKHPFCHKAITLRRYDDEAKIKDMNTESLPYFIKQYVQYAQLAL